MLYAYDDEDNAPMIDFFLEPGKNYVYKTLAELGFTEKPKHTEGGEVGDD